MCNDDFVRRAEDDDRTRNITDIPFRLKYVKARVRSAEHDCYTAPDGTVGHNLYRFVDIGADKTIVFLAHHDVARHGIQNCNDNTASVCQLLELAERFSKQRKSLKHNVCVAWVDYEERCNTHIAGASQLARKIKAGDFGNVTSVLNLELTSCGDQYWFNAKGPSDTLQNHLLNLDFDQVFCPMNDAYHLDANGVAAICIGSYREQDRKIVVEQKRAGCELWTSCHKHSDTFEKWAVEDEMSLFNDVLFRIAIDLENDDNAVYDMNKQYVAPPSRLTFGTVPASAKSAPARQGRFQPFKPLLNEEDLNDVILDGDEGLDDEGIFDDRLFDRDDNFYTAPHVKMEDPEQNFLTEEEEYELLLDRVDAAEDEITSLKQQVADMKEALLDQQEFIDAIKTALLNQASTPNP